MLQTEGYKSIITCLKVNFPSCSAMYNVCTLSALPLQVQNTDTVFYIKLEIVLYTLFVLSFPTKLTGLYRTVWPLRRVPLSLLCGYKPKWRALPLRYIILFKSIKKMSVFSKNILSYQLCRVINSVPDCTAYAILMNAPRGS